MNPIFEQEGVKTNKDIWVTLAFESERARLSQTRHNKARITRICAKLFHQDRGWQQKKQMTKCILLRRLRSEDAQ